MSMSKYIRSQWFNVYRPAVQDTMFYTSGLELIDEIHYMEHRKVTEDEVRRSLIDHDGYPADIIVRKQK